MCYKKTIFVCINDPVFYQLEVFLETLFDTERGNFQGNVVVLTDHLGKFYRNKLENFGHEVFEFENLWDKKFAKTVNKIIAFELAKKLSQTSFLLKAFSKITRKINLIDPFREVKPSAVYSNAKLLYRFHYLPILRNLWEREKQLWKRKHLSKFLILDYLNQREINRDEVLVVADSDMIFQKDFSAVLNQCVLPGKVSVGGEYYNNLTNGKKTSSVYWSNLAARKKNFFNDLKFGKEEHELNIGLTAGFRDEMKWLFSNLFSFMANPDYEDLWYCDPVDFWHEQDFFRAFLNQNSENVCLLKKEHVYHATGRAVNFIEFSRPTNSFIIKDSNQVPVVVHFAGSEMKKSNDVKALYE